MTDRMTALTPEQMRALADAAANLSVDNDWDATVIADVMAALRAAADQQEQHEFAMAKAYMQYKAAAAELDRLRAANEFNMSRLVKHAADEWFDERAPSNVSMDDLNLLVHMITEKLNGGKP